MEIRLLKNVFSQKCWRSLNLAVSPQTKYLNFVVAPHSVLHHHKHCAWRVLLSAHLRYLNNAMSSQIYKKYNWQCANVELAICTACIEGRWAGPRVILHALLHDVLRSKIVVADFNLAVSTPTTKPPNLFPRQIFRLYGI